MDFTPSKLGPFTQAIFVAETRCNFCRAKVMQLQSRTCKPDVIFSAICRRDIFEHV